MSRPAASMACLHTAQEMSTIPRVNDVNTLQIHNIAGADSGVAWMAHVGGFVFFSGFDSGNLGKVELVEPEPEESPQDSSNLNLDENLENLLPEKSNSATPSVACAATRASP